MKLTKTDILSVPHQLASGFDGLKNFSATGVSLDSRTVKPGDVFIALRGQQFDGHNFLSRAVEAGAAAIIVDRRWADANPAMMVSIHIPRLVVENTEYAVGALANIHRRKFRIPVIAVAGSNGKTTTKEMIRAVLGTRFTVLATEGNHNNQIGVPLTLFQLEQKHDVAVVEIGTNHPGEIASLCTILEPTHGLITNIGREHLEFFGTEDGVAAAEGELFDWLAQHHGFAFVNADDARIPPAAKKVKKSLRYGFRGNRLNVRGTILSMSPSAQAAIRVKPGTRKAFDVALGISGEHNAANALAAAVVGIQLRVPVSRIQNALASFMPAGMRSQVLRAANITILNDTYNANPDSTLAALAVLHSVQTSGKKIAVLADMLELGPASEAMHREIGKAIAQYGVDILLTIGPAARFIHDAALVESKTHFDNKSALIGSLVTAVAAGDVVLFKGSRGMKMEEAVAGLTDRLANRPG